MARVECLVERAVEQRAGTELDARRALLAARPEQPDRTSDPFAGRGHEHALGLGAGEAADVDAADRRADRDRASLQ